jgi:hypothetical protein
MFQASAEGAILDHQFRVAAYVVTWVVQFGYVVWLAMKWRAQKREAERLGINRPKTQR